MQRVELNEHIDARCLSCRQIFDTGELSFEDGSGSVCVKQVTAFGAYVLHIGQARRRNHHAPIMSTVYCSALQVYGTNSGAVNSSLQEECTAVVRSQCTMVCY